MGCGQEIMDNDCFDLDAVPTEAFTSDDFYRTEDRSPSPRASQKSIVSEIKNNVVKAATVASDNIVKPCLKGGAVGALGANQALNKAAISPHPAVKAEIIKDAAIVGCAAGIVDNGLEKSFGIGLVSGVKDGINLLVKPGELGEASNTVHCSQDEKK